MGYNAEFLLPVSVRAITVGNGLDADKQMKYGDSVCYRKSDIGNCSWLCIPEAVADVRTAFISVKDKAELINGYNAGVEEHQR